MINFTHASEREIVTEEKPRGLQYFTCDHVVSQLNKISFMKSPREKLKQIMIMHAHLKATMQQINGYFN